MPRGPKAHGLLYPFRDIIAMELIEERVLDREGDWLGQVVTAKYEILSCGHKKRWMKNDGAGSRKTRRCTQCPGYLDREDPEGRGIP